MASSYHRTRGVFRRRNRRRVLIAGVLAPVAIGPWGGIFWENLCTEFDHTRTAQEITDGKDWATDWETCPSGVFQLYGPSTALTASDVTSRQPLWDDSHDFQTEVEAENWTNADTLRLSILAWTP